MTSFGWVILALGVLVGGGVALIGTYVGRRQTKTSEHFFTGGRNVTMSLMTATWIAYAVGTGLIFSPAESAYLTGMSAMIGYALALTIAYLVFIPVSRKIRSRIPEGHHCRVREGSLRYADAVDDDDRHGHLHVRLACLEPDWCGSDL